MRVCYISTQAVSTDGWGRYTVEVISGARGHGVEPVLITARSETDPALADCEHHPILPPLFTGRFTTPRTLLRIPQVRSIMNTCDLVHCMAEPYAPLAAFALPRGLPYILSVYGTWAVRPLERPLSRFLFGYAFRRANIILTISAYTRDRMARLLDLPHIEVLPGGVHPERFARPVQADLPEWVGRDPVVLSAGAIKPRKGQHIALEAVAIARQQIPTLHYAMTGNVNTVPDYAASLKRRIAELGLEDYVHFLGLLDAYGALIAWFQQADVFILPSISQESSFEGLGMVFLEAGAAGTPSIGTWDCGAEEAIIHEKTGLLVPQNDPQATADALIRMLNDDALRARMGEAARAHAQRLSWTNLVGRVVALYQELTGSMRQSG